MPVSEPVVVALINTAGVVAVAWIVNRGVTQIRHVTNSLKDELVETARKEGWAAGKAAGLDERDGRTER